MMTLNLVINNTNVGSILDADEWSDGYREEMIDSVPLPAENQNRPLINTDKTKN